MTGKLHRLLSSTRALEAKLAAAFEKTAADVVRPAGAAPLEVVDQAVEAVARHVQFAGRGRYAFPFNDVAVTFAAPAADVRAALEALCAGPPTLQDRVVSRLLRAGCSRADVDLRVAFATAPGVHWARPDFHLVLSRLDDAERVARTPAFRVELTVTQGTADRGAYLFTSTPIAIGRGLEVRDSRHVLLRINHVAFTEGADDVNQSVSRRHARIESDPQTNRLRIIDDNSAQGTSVVRAGRGIAVPRGSRGLGLQSDDEIVVGQARLKIRIGKA
jgi:hypothetical protein